MMKIIDVVNENINYREKKPYYIYIHTCPNRMVYIGQSKIQNRDGTMEKDIKIIKSFMKQ